MKKILFICLLFMIFVVSPCLAVFDYEDNSNTNQQQQGQIGINKNDNTNQQGQAQIGINENDNRNINVNDLSNRNKNQQQQGQGQIANGKVETKTNVEGDSIKSYANAWPALVGGEGLSQANVYSIFGGVGLSNTEKYKMYIVQIQAIEASESLSKEEKEAMIRDLYAKMLATDKTQRFCAIGWETSGRNLLNLFGILSCDSFWPDGRTPIDILFRKRARTDTAVTGNAGYINQ